MPNIKLADLPDVLTVTVAAQALGISRMLAYQAVRDGRLGHVRVGDRIIVPKEAVLEFLGTWRDTIQR